MTTIKYYNGTGYGYFELKDPAALFEESTQKQTKMFFKSVLQRSEEAVSIAGYMLGLIIDSLSELYTLSDIIEADPKHKRSELTRIQTRIKRLEKAKKLCQEI